MTNSEEVLASLRAKGWGSIADALEDWARSGATKSQQPAHPAAGYVDDLLRPRAKSSTARDQQAAKTLQNAAPGDRQAAKFVADLVRGRVEDPPPVSTGQRSSQRTGDAALWRSAGRVTQGPPLNIRER